MPKQWLWAFPGMDRLEIFSTQASGMHDLTPLLGGDLLLMINYSPEGPCHSADIEAKRNLPKGLAD
jgi:hypothetical protein